VLVHVDARIVGRRDLRLGPLKFLTVHSCFSGSFALLPRFFQESVYVPSAEYDGFAFIGRMQLLSLAFARTDMATNSVGAALGVNPIQIQVNRAFFDTDIMATLIPTNAAFARESLTTAEVTDQAPDAANYASVLLVVPWT